MAKSKADKTNLKQKTKHVKDDIDDFEDVAVADVDEPKVKSKTSMDKKTKHVKEEDVEEFAVDDSDAPPVKSKKSKRVDDDELQVKADDDAEEVVVDDDEPKVKSRTGTKKTTKHLDDDELQVKADDDAEIPVDDAEAEAKPDDNEASIDEAPKPPRAKLTRTTIALILLNWILAPTFLYLAYVDNVVRTQYTYRATLNYVQVWGLPLKSEEDFPSLANDTRPRLRMTPDQLSEAVKARTKKSFKDFQPVEETLDKPLSFRLRPSDMENAHLKRDVFQDVPDPVTTLDEAIEKLLESLPAAINTAADEAVAKLKNAKDDDEKRAVIAKILVPIAWDVRQVKKLDDKLASTKGAELDTMLKDAAQRRMYYDILAPLNVYMPGQLSDFKNYTVEKLSSIDDYDMNQVKKFLTDRLKAVIADTYDPAVHRGKEYWQDGLKRDSVEKRHKIGFILFTISQTSAPTLDRKLIPKGVERAQVISGLYEFTDSSIHFVRAVRVLEERLMAAVIADRQGHVAMLEGKLTNTPGFIAEYDAEIDRLVKIVEHIDIAEKQLAHLKIKHDTLQKVYVQRVDQHKRTLDELLESRKKTAIYAKDLRVFQDQLHSALVELSDAAEVNFRLHDDIRNLELKKGGKK